MCRKRSSCAHTGVSLVGIVVATLLGGCAFAPWRATPFRPPSDVAHLQLERRDSEQVVVDKIWLERKKDGLFVRGYVMAQLGVTDTTGSYLLVSLRDSQGAELRSMSVDFHPRQIPRQRRPSSGVAGYRAALDPLPAKTAIILVTARDDRTSD